MILFSMITAVCMISPYVLCYGFGIQKFLGSVNTQNAAQISRIIGFQYFWVFMYLTPSALCYFIFLDFFEYGLAWTQFLWRSFLFNKSERWINETERILLEQLHLEARAWPGDRVQRRTGQV